MDNDKTKQLLKTIDLLYDAVCDLGKWPFFLESASTLFDSHGSQVGHHDLANQNLTFSRLYGYEWSADHYLKYDTLMDEDPRIPYFKNNPFRPFHCRMAITEKTLHESRIYKEVLSVGGVEYTLGVNLDEEDLSLSYFLALRHRYQQPFGNSECEIMEEMIPHLRRAFKLQREMGMIDFEKGLALDTLDSMAVGILVINANCNIRFANKTAREIINTNDGVSEYNGELITDASSSQKFRLSVRRIISQVATGTQTPGEALLVERPSKSSPYNLLISPFWGGRLRLGWSEASEPYALVVLRDPIYPKEKRQEILSRLYNLTPSQSSLASLICDGLSIQDAALKSGITEASARQYVKIVFHKMGVTRQGEMIGKILTLPHQ